MLILYHFIPKLRLNLNSFGISFLSFTLHLCFYFCYGWGQCAMVNVYGDEKIKFSSYGSLFSSATM